MRPSDAGSASAVYDVVLRLWEGHPNARTHLQTLAHHMTLDDFLYQPTDPQDNTVITSLSTAKIGTFFSAFFSSEESNELHPFALQFMQILRERKEALRTGEVSEEMTEAQTVAIRGLVQRNYGAEVDAGRTQSQTALRYITQQVEGIRVSLAKWGALVPEQSAMVEMDSPSLLRAMLSPNDAVLLALSVLLGGVLPGSLRGDNIDDEDCDDDDIASLLTLKSSWRSSLCHSNDTTITEPESPSSPKQPSRIGDVLHALASVELIHEAENAPTATGQVGVGMVFDPVHPQAPTSWGFFSSVALFDSTQQQGFKRILTDAVDVDGGLKNMQAAKIVDLKYDGERLLIHRKRQDNKNVYKLFSRNMFEVPEKKIPNELLSSLDAAIPETVEDVILDAEVLSKHTRGSLNHLPAHIVLEHPVVYVFDVLFLNGYSLLSAPLFLRRALLHSHIVPSPIRHKVEICVYSILACTAGEAGAASPALLRLRAGLDFMVRRQLEGVVVKPALSQYFLGNKGLWRKVKRNYLDLTRCPVSTHLPEDKAGLCLDIKVAEMLSCACAKCVSVKSLSRTLIRYLSADVATPALPVVPPTQPTHPIQPQLTPKRKRDVTPDLGAKPDGSDEDLIEAADLCVIGVKWPKKGAIPEKWILGTFAQGGGGKLVAVAELDAPFPKALEAHMQNLWRIANGKFGRNIPSFVSVPEAVQKMPYGTYSFIRDMGAKSCFVMQVNGPKLGVVVPGASLPVVRLERLRKDKAAFSCLTTVKEMEEMLTMRKRRKVEKK